MADPLIMRISLKAIGFLKEIIKLHGGPDGWLDVPCNSTLHQVLLLAGLSNDTPWIIIINGKLATGNPPLCEGDEIELIPPINGG